MKTSVSCRNFQTTSICVDSYEDSVLKGRLFNPNLPEGRAFCGVTQLLIELDRAPNNSNGPRTFLTPRKFEPTLDYSSDPSGPFRDGALATFTVRILFRQNASWQGVVTWIEGRQEQSFRSVLELILLLDSALRDEKAS